MWKEFKEFALKGNTIDLAVGIIIGGAFQKITSSLVNDILMPVISIFTVQKDFSEAAIQIGDSSIKYGAFITSITDFLIMAFTLFLIIRYINKLNKTIENVAEESAKKLKRQPFFKKLRKGKEKFEDEKKKKKKEKPIPPPTTKICPYCFKEININATRCPYCTSEQTVQIDNQIKLDDTDK